MFFDVFMGKGSRKSMNKALRATNKGPLFCKYCTHPMKLTKSRIYSIGFYTNKFETENFIIRMIWRFIRTWVHLNGTEKGVLVKCTKAKWVDYCLTIENDIK